MQDRKADSGSQEGVPPTCAAKVYLIIWKRSAPSGPDGIVAPPNDIRLAPWAGLLSVTDRLLPPSAPQQQPDHDYDTHQDEQVGESVLINHCRTINYRNLRRRSLPHPPSSCAHGGQMLVSSASSPWAADRRLRPLNAVWR